MVKTMMKGNSNNFKKKLKAPAPPFKASEQYYTLEDEEETEYHLVDPDGLFHERYGDALKYI